jgi:predicted ABC-type transport system involved in lysophospholipase L1 biosynthesis ATPase subunit
MGFIFQSFNLVPRSEMSAKNVEFPCCGRKEARARGQQGARKERSNGSTGSIEQVGLSPMAHTSLE